MRYIKAENLQKISEKINFAAILLKSCNFAGQIISKGGYRLL